MNARRTAILLIAGLLSLRITATPVMAEPSRDTELWGAYFAEHELHQYAEARAVYQRVLESGDEKAGYWARAGADRCRDHLAAENFATLMPADSLAYIELTRPGEVFEKLASMLGLAGKDMAEILAQRPSAESKAPFHMPKEIAISPAIFEVLRAFGGAAVAITSFDPNHDGPPTGLLALHHGDVTLLKGLLETAFQFSPTAEKIHELPTFSVEIPDHGRITGVLTESLLIVGTTRELVEGAVGRLVGSKEESLASREDLKEIADQRKGSTLFGYVDIQAAMKIAKQHMSERDLKEFGVANALADVDNLRWVAFSWGIHDGTLSSQLALRLADGHHSFVYNLLRLPPMSGKCLSMVPSDAAAVFGLGLNPGIAQAASDAAQRVGKDVSITGFDIGREFFGNLQEICAFVVPGKMAAGGEDGPRTIPNVGILMASNDTAKSRALWNQLFSLPGLMSGDEPLPPKSVKVGEVDATAYSIPKLGKIYLAEFDHCLAIGLTRNAIKATIRAQDKGASILKDPVMSKAIAKLPQDSSIMAVANVGRLAQVAAGMGDPGMAVVAHQIAEMCPETIVGFGLGQSPTQLTLRWNVSGLPNVNEAVKRYGPMVQGAAAMMFQHDHGRDMTAKKQKKDIKKRSSRPKSEEPETEL